MKPVFIGTPLHAVGITADKLPKGHCLQVCKCHTTVILPSAPEGDGIILCDDCVGAALGLRKVRA